MLKPEEMIGSYRLDKIIGSGSSASVYLAQSIHSHHQVAIKLRPRTHGQHESILASRFTESARLHYQFCHPNIAWLHETIEHETYQAVVIEYLQGGTLSELLKRRQLLSLDEVCLLGVHLADGLEHMHDIQIIHRDIKPDNILFANAQKLSTVRIADFDVSKNPYHSPNLTEKGAHVGTLCYVAPEQFNQEKPRPIADIYSLAIVLFECTSGRLPYASISMPAIFSHFLDQKPFPKLSQFNGQVSPAFDWVIEQALMINPEQRIPSAASFAVLLLALSESARQQYSRVRVLSLQTRVDWLKTALSEAPKPVQDELYPSLRKLGFDFF